MLPSRAATLGRKDFKMREILFRGKTHNGEWKQGYYVEQYGAKEIYLPDGVDREYGFDHYHVIPETVGQYTGLTDKNGKKIFEGDIVLFEDESPSNYEYHDCTEMRCGAIEYGDNCFYITDRIAVEMEDLIYDGKLDVEVIGNIHDNPELLQGE